METVLICSEKTVKRSWNSHEIKTERQAVGKVHGKHDQRSKKFVKSSSRHVYASKTKQQLYILKNTCRKTFIIRFYIKRWIMFGFFEVIKMWETNKNEPHEKYFQERKCVLYVSSYSKICISIKKLKNLDKNKLTLLIFLCH